MHDLTLVIITILKASLHSYLYISGEREKRTSAEMKAKNLEKKLEMYQTVKVAIDGTLPELMERLDSMGDLSDDARYSLR